MNIKVSAQHNQTHIFEYKPMTPHRHL